jgi:hypothetical protein
LAHDSTTYALLGAAAEALNDSLMDDAPNLMDLAIMVTWTVVLASSTGRTFRWE